MHSFRRQLGRKFYLTVFSLIALSLSAGKASALTCSEVRQLTMIYFKMHFLHNTFNDDISSKTLENFIKLWDPGKLYFYQADVDKFRDKYSNKLDDLVYVQMNCEPITEMMNLYSKRFAERQKHIDKLIESKFDFTIDEYMEVDRKKMKFAKTTEEVNERWRKRVKFQLLSLKTSMDGDIKKAREKLRKRYDLALRRHSDLTTDRVMGVFLNAFSNALDPHSSYMPADDLEDFRIKTRLSLEGIGASLRSEDGFTIVASLVKGGAAAKGGLLKINDKIIAVAQGEGEPVDVIDMDLQDVVKKIRGARGTTVKLTVMREDSKSTRKLIIPIVREKIQLVEQQASSDLIEVEQEVNGKKKTVKIGVVTLPSFYIDFEGRQKRLKNYRSSSADTRREIEKLKKQGIDGLIVDLRNNGGGALEESINMAGLFFDEGPVVQIKAQNGETETYFDPDPKTWYDGPLVVAINRHSASASEIFAGAIQDYGRGIIVGDSHTFGKGTVQNLQDLAPSLGAIKVTVNQFYRASGLSTQLNGVESDLVLPSLVDQFEIGEKFYDYALPFGKIKTASYKKMGQVKTHLDELQKRSQTRIQKSFAEVREDIQEFKKNKEERSRVSLMVKKEKDEKDAKEEPEEEVAEDDGEYSLDKDIYLQESLKIAADYVQLLNGKSIKKNNLSIPLVEKAKADKAKKAKAMTQNQPKADGDKAVTPAPKK